LWVKGRIENLALAEGLCYQAPKMRLENERQAEEAEGIQ
jgi:hypothetical protein